MTLYPSPKLPELQHQVYTKMGNYHLLPSKFDLCFSTCSVKFRDDKDGGPPGQNGPQKIRAKTTILLSTIVG